MNCSGQPYCSSRREAGFTLIEVMIVAAVVAILAAVAYPAYEDSRRRAARADVQSDLMELAQASERFFSQNNRYDQTRAGAAYVLPFTQSPRSGVGLKYNILFVTAAAGQTYTLQAVPVGKQVADVCGTLTINQLGVSTPALGTNGRPCW
ncbi:type IV pilin protein [Hydrogenophaga sp. 5NK40-0174]|uniref:type IV pilin protein n=1 Tax=Hydrogenophaga sp. 5NK40-0174 TaxID=3127649 RepID=UPI003104A5E3